MTNLWAIPFFHFYPTVFRRYTSKRGYGLNYLDPILRSSLSLLPPFAGNFCVTPQTQMFRKLVKSCNARKTISFSFTKARKFSCLFSCFHKFRGGKGLNNNVFSLTYEGTLIIWPSSGLSENIQFITSFVLLYEWSNIKSYCEQFYIQFLYFCIIYIFNV